MRSNFFNLLGYEYDLPELINRKNVVSWFEIPVLNTERAVKFYSNVFRVKIREENGMFFFPMTKFADGASGSLVKVENNKPTKTGTLIYFYTDNLDKSIKLVLSNGGKLLKVEDIGKYGKYAHVLDTEGNRIGIHMER